MTNTELEKHIWVDADACPVVIKDILIKASMRCNIMLSFVANQWINIPSHKLIRMLKVANGFDVADNEIVKRIQSGHLLISADIPLAAAAIEKGAEVLSPRGEMLNDDNIKSRLSMRNFMEDLRLSGVDTGGPSALNNSNRRDFSKYLEQYLLR